VTYRYRINKIIFNNGDEISLKALTVIVGPNNSGKSRILKDILELATKQDPNVVLLRELDFSMPDSFEDLVTAYNIKLHMDKSGNCSLRPLLPTLAGTWSTSMGNSTGWEEMWKNNLKNKAAPKLKQSFGSTFGNHFLTFLNTEDRLRLITAYSSSGNIEMETASLLQAFYKSESKAENILRPIIKGSFGMDIRLDYSHLSNLYLRVGDNLEDIPLDPRDALPIFEAHEKIDEQGDGIKSFVATVLAMIAINRPILMIDEPEAFLYPPQATRLGELIAEYAIEDRQTLVVTHSSDLLRGILSKRQDIDIIRIERSGNTNSTHHLDPNELRTIANDPLLGSSRILEGLFYKGVVIVEADSDSIFYHRISRNLELNDDIHFTHAHSKQAIPKVAESYANLGIKFSVIVDFDILRVRGEFKDLLTKMGVGSATIGKLLEMQKEIVEEIESVDKLGLLRELTNGLEKLKADISATENRDPDNTLLRAQRELKRIREKSSTWCNYKAEGYQSLTREGQKTFLEIDSICRENGIFIVAVGELESWLVEYGVTRVSNKSKWILNALSKLSEISINNSQSVGKFIVDIHNYLMSEYSSLDYNNCTHGEYEALD